MISRDTLIGRKKMKKLAEVKRNTRMRMKRDTIVLRWFVTGHMP